MPFRDAYKKIGMEVQNGTYKPTKTVNHTHLGSIGNLANDKIASKMNRVISQLNGL